MQQGVVDLVIVGADRITKDVVFNKIGTNMHAVCARHTEIPLMSRTAFQFRCDESAGEVMIEKWDRDEIACRGQYGDDADGVPAINYAFDRTPMSLEVRSSVRQGCSRPTHRYLKRVPIHGCIPGNS